MKPFAKHYILQRVTACFSLAIIPWFLWNVFFLKNSQYHIIVKHFTKPSSVILVSLMLLSGFYHSYLGLYNICLDYLPNPKIRSICIYVIALSLSAVSVFAVFSLLQLMMT
ncbi:MAG: succinate dehydrogenase, hydrophobic membrane anchor protein [Pseudomonadota bacterium]|jgi:succinate dehydrogenase hydrophobic membrane anchor protein|nr:succinate dehydrogenase, hydrophobic membrane anchor protein [Alphaproteobacteria bacterium]